MAEDKKDTLKAYRQKRDFAKTPEPAGKAGRGGRGPVFVVQKHEARSLHYDFRLEVDGVLKSWAVPKGPSADPSDKRLAVMTEDHPLEYAEFEGVIPEGHYGAGTVTVWDRGTCRNLRGEKKDEKKRKTMAESIEDGKVEVWLEGEKLKGGYVLIKTNYRGGNGWLLKKMKDKEADAGKNAGSGEPGSAGSRRTAH